MGEVYRALDLRLKPDVALKVISPCIAADADQLRRGELLSGTRIVEGSIALEVPRRS